MRGVPCPNTFTYEKKKEMKKITAVSKTNVQVLNNFIKYFREQLNKLHLPGPKHWRISKIQGPNVWIYKYIGPEVKNIQWDVPHFGIQSLYPEIIDKSIKVEFSNNPKYEEVITAYVNILFHGNLYGDLFDPSISTEQENDLAKALGELLLKEKRVTADKINGLIAKYGNRPHLSIILENARLALSNWVREDNYTKAVKAGAILERSLSALPEDVKQSPSNTLYRALLVQPKMWTKIKQGKPLILKNRKYSSWTYDLKAAKEFANRKDTMIATAVILRRTFKDENILLNVIPAVKFLHIKSNYYIAKEKEIIVKNVQKDFTFKPSEIYLHEGLGGWKYFSSAEKE